MSGHERAILFASLMTFVSFSSFGFRAVSWKQKGGKRKSKPTLKIGFFATI